MIHLAEAKYHTRLISSITFQW